MKSKETRRAEAKVRQAKFDQLSPRQKLDRAILRGSKKEQLKWQMRLPTAVEHSVETIAQGDAQAAAAKKPKKKQAK